MLTFFSLTLEYGSQKHNEKPKTDSNPSAEHICCIAAEQQRTDTTDVLDRREEAESGAGRIIKVCNILR